MTEIQVVDFHEQRALLPVVPETPVNVRPAAPGSEDFEFIDDLQKKHSRNLGFMHRKTIEAYIEAGDLLIAEEMGIGHQASGIREESESGPNAECRMPNASARPLGYIMGRDKYFKHEDVGILYQLAVIPGSRRSLIGAMLVQAMFDQAAYGCKLFCLWCAQDLEANHFWEACGFVPLAFRTGSAQKKGQERIHIFWQKRIRAGDNGPGATPYWFPSETKGGAIGEGRLVIPIPIGTHWSDAKPVVLPGVPQHLAIEGEEVGDQKSEVSEGRPRKARPRNPRNSRKKEPAKTEPRSVSAMSGLRFGPTPDEIAAEQEAQKEARKARSKRRPKMKNNPEYVAAARELRDRFLEAVEHDPQLLDGQATGGKYDVSRQLQSGNATTEGTESTEALEVVAEVRLLDAA